jgi:arabinose-5-phosphate isomerase
MITKDDMAMVLSNSGNTRELHDLIHYCKALNVPIIGMTMGPQSYLAKHSDYLLLLPQYDEASTTLNAPTTSCSMMLALGDALMTVTHELKGFTKSVFATVHPGGAIGAATKQITTIMHSVSGTQVPVVTQGQGMVAALEIMSRLKVGVCGVVGKQHKLLGVISEDALRSHMRENVAEKIVDDVMDTGYKVLPSTSLAKDAMVLMNENRSSSAFVADDGVLKGIVYLHDFVAL